RQESASALILSSSTSLAAVIVLETVSKEIGSDLLDVTGESCRRASRERSDPPSHRSQDRADRGRVFSMPILLVTNDDGVHAAGLAALARALEDLGDVYVLAPEREQSACGHALTLHRPLRVEPLRERWFSVNGTPSDCVNLGVLGFLPERPVLIASGVNHGTNLGDDVTYSGTVSAAMEGLLL